MNMRIVLVLTGLIISGWLQAMGLPGPIVDTNWLANNKDKVVILDVRKDVRSFQAKPVYIRDKKSGKSKLVRVGGHIDGARLIDYGRIRVTQTIDGRKVTRNMADRKTFESLLQAAGVNNQDKIIIVSKGESNADMTMATRLYWQLKYYGHQELAILDGGMAQWLLDKRAFARQASKFTKGQWQATQQDKSILADSDEVANSQKTGGVQLIDTRAVSLYLGTYRRSYVYADGHIPGAKNYPNELLTKPSLPAKFIGKDDSRKLFAALGIDPAATSITYCNSGHLASGSWFILHEVLGNPHVKLYDGSMHQWTLEKRPTESLVAH